MDQVTVREVSVDLPDLPDPGQLDEVSSLGGSVEFTGAELGVTYGARTLSVRCRLCGPRGLCFGAGGGQ